MSYAKAVLVCKRDRSGQVKLNLQPMAGTVKEWPRMHR